MELELSLQFSVCLPSFCNISDNMQSIKNSMRTKMKSGSDLRRDMIMSEEVMNRSLHW